MAKAHKDYTIADMLRLGGAWVKTYEDIDALRQIAGTLAMMDKATTDVTVERFMLPDKSIESDVEKIKAICLSIDNPTHTVQPPIKISSLYKSKIKADLSKASEVIANELDKINTAKDQISRAYRSIAQAANMPLSGIIGSINPTESSTFSYLGEWSNKPVLVQTVPTNLSRVDPDGNITQRCMGRYVVVLTLSSNGTIYPRVCASVDGLNSNEDNYIHPNVNLYGEMCFGDGNAEAARLMGKGDIVGLLAIVDRVLRTSQYGSPYRHLETFDEHRRASVTWASLSIKNDYNGIANMLMPLATSQAEPSTGSSKVLAVPIDEVLVALDMSRPTPIEIVDTDIPEVVCIPNGRIRYMPRSVFKVAVKTEVPTTGAWKYADGTYAINGRLYGERNEYETPVEVVRYQVTQEPSVVSGLLVVDDEVCYGIAKYVAGVIVALFVKTSVGIKRVATIDMINTFHPTGIAPECGGTESTFRYIVDIGTGLACVAGKNVTRVINNERITSDDDISSMPRYAI